MPLSPPPVFVRPPTAGLAAPLVALLLGLACDRGAVTAASVADPVSPAPVVAPTVVVLPAGSNLQAAVDAHPAGTHFVLKAGVYRRQSVVPKDGMEFEGEPGGVALLTGEGAVEYAFHWGAGRYPRDVTLRRLTIERYNPPAQAGAVHAGDHDGAPATTGWTVADCEIRYNGGAGIRLGHKMQVLRNKVHHNAQIGVTGIGDDVLVEGNEIAFNNYQRAYDWGWEAGGTKFVLTNRLVVRGNYVHDNVGPGLWTDIDNRSTYYDGNRVENNKGPGILHEISWAAVIANNTVRGNGFDDPEIPWVHGAGILVQNSSGVEVHHNTVVDNYNAITAMYQKRGRGIYGPWETHELWVHDNVVRVPTGAVGLAQDVGSAAVFLAWNNRFQGNTYQVGAANGRAFRWNDRWLSAAEWKAAGQDTLGTVVTF